jgi:NADH-quinone oxidoreductase subunit C
MTEPAGLSPEPDIPAAATPPGGSLAERLRDTLGDGIELTVTAGGLWASWCLEIPADRWREAVAAARDACGLTFFDWLTAAAAPDEGGVELFHLVTHLWSVPERAGLLLRTTLVAADPRVDSVIDVFPGAAWHERETFEMFGIVFDGHPELRKLLLTDEFDGHPLRKEFVLASRVAKAWPGEKEPGDGGTPTGRARRRMLPPGVPEPGTWPAPPAAEASSDGGAA